MSEVFREVMESFYEAQGHLVLNLREGLLAQRAEIYADGIKSAGAPLDCCVGFIHCTKIQMSRPGGHSSLQRSCYSGHERFHCLMCGTPDSGSWLGRLV